MNPDNDRYYMFPVRPGEENFLAGTMGELRSTHFHSAIDIKTSGIQGLPVYASADGFVSRVRVSGGGYGNALYLAHPNGTFTVYAHLQKFDPDVAAYVRMKQYEQQSFDVDLHLGPNTFRFNKGDVIARSGNSGSSSGPHLHFEIRDQNQQVLDPLSYYFPEIKDHIRPTVSRIAFTTLDIDSRINGEFGRFEIPVERIGHDFFIRRQIMVRGQIGVELLAYDKLDGASNRNGIPFIEMLQDGESIFRQTIRSFSFSKTRNVLVHTNYAAMVAGRKRFVKLYVDDGNELDFYQTNEIGGRLLITDTLSHEFQIVLKDAYGNESTANFELIGSGMPLDHVPTTLGTVSATEESAVINNTLVLRSQVIDQQIKLIEFYHGSMKVDLAPAYIANQEAIYLWDLRKGLPDSVNLCHKMEYFNFGASVPSYREFKFFDSRMNISFPKTALFDTLYLEKDYQLDTDNLEIFTIGDPMVPLRRHIQVEIKPVLDYPDDPRTQVYQRYARNRYEFIGGEWKDNQIQFSTRSFGEFTLVTDSIPPTIRVIAQNASDLKFVIRDNLAGIKDYEVTVNGEWVLMNYDPKRNLIWSEKLDQNIPFSGELRLRVRDNAENEKIYQTNI